MKPLRSAAIVRWAAVAHLARPSANPASIQSFAGGLQRNSHAQIFGRGRANAPLPEHYEPLECSIEKNLLSGQRMNPTAPVYGTKADEWASCDPRYPYVGSTYRVVEHWQTGVLTRWQPWLLEMQPQVFVEMSEELALLKGI